MIRTLYSWLDVDFLLQRRRAAGEWPEWLLGASAYHDGLTLRVKDGAGPNEVDGTLSLWFGPRYVHGKGLLLEGVPDAQRTFRVDIEHVSDGDVREPFTLQPTFRRVALFPEEHPAFTWPQPLSAGSAPLVAFYSYKGGVGRTTHLLAYLLALASKARPLRSLVVDADLEAPGLTSLLNAEKGLGAYPFSFVDLLALAHGDADPSLSMTLAIASHALRRQTISLSLGKVPSEHFVLPAFGDSSKSLWLDIRPEHLIATPSEYWAVGDLLSRLGSKVGAEVVLVDLRAGLSELASPILFDPRVRRLLITTPSRQSFDGTLLVLGEIGKLAPLPEREDLFDPTVIISFVTPELSKSGSVQGLEARLLERYPQLAGDVDLATIRIEQTGFAQELLYLNSVTDALEKLKGTSVAKVVTQIAEENTPQPPSPAPKILEFDLESARARLSKMAADLEYAESGRGERFLAIAPIRNLGKQFTDVPPIAVVVGPKGAGKTYTCLQILRSELWSRFVVSATGERIKPEWGLLWPMIQSRNLKDSATTLVANCRRNTLSEFRRKPGLTNLEVEDAIRESLRHTKADDTWWRHRWFSLIGKSLGIETGTDNAAAGELIKELRAKRKRLVVVIDGLEDLFPALARKQTEQVALRALLQGVPNHLRETPDCPLGVVVFIRADLALEAIPQNFGQFYGLYQSFALRWNEHEALRLAVWISIEAQIPLPLLSGSKPEFMGVDDAKEALTVLWGKKLGPDKSREARSAEWVIAALSDFNGQIQARDLVRFLASAAADNRNSTVSDRVLASRAIRDAIEPCSNAKIEEIKQEIPRLKDIFTRLQQSTDRRIPFDTASSGLKVQEIRFLENVGILFEDRGEYFMPEIFRLGLGFQLAQGARPRVLSLARRAAR